MCVMAEIEPGGRIQMQAEIRFVTGVQVAVLVVDGKWRVEDRVLGRFARHRFEAIDIASLDREAFVLTRQIDRAFVI